MKGKFIAIYGVNNIGKTTQARLFVERLNLEGRKAVYVKFPVYDLAPTGPFIDSVLRNPRGQSISEDELQLWFVLNRYQYEPELMRLLAEGYIVVAEDYVGTGVAWGSAKGLSREWLISVNQFLLREDLGVLFQGQRRLESKEENHVHEQNEQLVEKCRLEFENLADMHEWKRFGIVNGIEETAGKFWDFMLTYV